MIKKQRLLSLDVFRGMTVIAMILVNNPGSWGKMYSPLKHAEWHGATPTDLIFPFFLFIVGVAIVFALGSRKQDSSQHNALLLKALKRGCILFLLGLFLHLFPSFDFANVRIFGVLQRIGIVYFVCAVLFIKTSPKTLKGIFAALLVGYWILMTWVPVPGIGPANLEKGTNLAAWIDLKVLTEAHVWKAAGTWDPEGLLSTIPAIATGIMGMFIGRILRKENVQPTEKVAQIFSYGLLATIAGLAWGLTFPINKALWTSSYVLYTGGIASMIFASLYFFIDVKGYKRGSRVFVAYGVNAMTVFFLSAIIAKAMNLIKVSMDGELVGSKTYLYKTFFSPYLSDYNASLAWAICFVMVFLAILWPMYRKNIIIKI